MRRFRVTFTKGEPVRYISHLDLMRTWERILRRAGVKLAYSQGFSPHPRLVFAAPLSVGITSDAELLDVFVDDGAPADEFVQAVRLALPAGIDLLAAEEVPLEAKPVMSLIDSAEYRVDVEAPADRSQAEAAVQTFLAAPSIPYPRTRKGKTREGDMRPVLLHLALDAWNGLQRLRMRLKLDQEGSAVRPDEVIRALDESWRVLRVHRTGLFLHPHSQASLGHAAA